MKLLKIFFHQHKDIILLFFLSLVPLLWYGTDPNTLILSHDVGYPADPIEVIKNRVFAWSSNINFGESQIGIIGTVSFLFWEVLLTLLTGSVFLGQRVYVIFWFFIPMLIMYLVLKRIPVFRDKPYMALLGAILFQFNLFQLQGWAVFWRARFSSYVSLPLILFILIEYLEGRKSLLRMALTAGLILFFFNGGGSPPQFGALIILVLSTIIYYLLLNFPGQFTMFLKRSLAAVLLISTVSFIMSSYWLFPYIHNILSSYALVISAGGGLTQVLGWTDSASRNASILNLFRLQGLDFFEPGNVHNFVKLYLNNPILVLVGFFWPILAFSALLWAKKEAEKKYILLLSILAIVGVVFTAGSHEPFREFFIFLLKTIPGFPIFRTAIYKFGGLLWFSYAILIAFSASSIIEKIATSVIKKDKFPKIPFIFSGIFIFLILFYHFPLFNRSFFVWNPPLTTMGRVPQYVFDFGRFINRENINTERILVLPEFNVNWHGEGFKWGYWSLNTLTSLLTGKNTLANDVQLTGQELLMVEKLYKTLKDSNPIWERLADIFSVKYFLLRKDFFSNLSWTPTTSPLIYQKLLEDNKKIKRINTLGEWDFYEIKNEPVSKIYQPSRSIFYQAQNEDIPKLIALFDKMNNYADIDFTLIPFDYRIIFSNKETESIIIPGPVNILLPVEKGKLVLLKPRFLPGSPFYFFVESEERDLIQKTTNSKEAINLYLGLSLKRLGELNEFLNSKRNVDPQDINNLLARYGILLSEIRQKFDSLRLENKDTTYILLRTKEFLSEERNLFASWINNQKNPTTKSFLMSSYKTVSDIIQTLKPQGEQEEIFSAFEQGSFDQNTVLLIKDYKWKVPETGTYDIYISGNSVLANSEELIVGIDDEEINYHTFQQGQDFRNDKEEDWQKIGEVELEKGEHSLKITADGIPVYSFKRGDMVFYKKDSKEQLTANSKQKISYTRLNPTRYKVEVDSLDKPFTLVFNERFDKDWKVYRLKNPKLLSGIINLLNENIFNTLFLKPLPEINHLKVNGYANAWRIEKSETSTFIIEYWPQRLLWVGYAVSIVSVFGSIIYLVGMRKKD